MEYLEGGSLANKLKAHHHHFISQTSVCFQILKYFQILEGVLFLHNKNICHNDIKPANILLTGDNLKFSDFGIAVRTDLQTETSSRRKGDFCYMSP